jgi:hypothetical protein
MSNTYQYSLAENGSLLCTRSQPAHERTRGLFIDQRADGYGASGVTGDWVMPANAIAGFGFFEYYIGDTGSYHRVLVPDILTAIDAGQPVDDPPALDVRHAAWPGKDKREIELEILAQRQRAIESALRRGREKRAREERERRRREQEAQWRAELEAAIEQQYGPLEAQITEALQAEFGPGFRL